jgi:hypothetical protein
MTAANESRILSRRIIEDSYAHELVEHSDGEVSHTLRIMFPEEHATFNVWLSSLGNLKGWKARKVAADRAKRWFKAKLAVALMGADRFPRARARVTIHSFRYAEADYDGLVGGAKYLVDVMVREKILVDDSPKWIGKPTYDQSIDRARRRTEITIEYFRKEKP